MEKGEILKQTQAHEAAKEAQEAQEASKLRAQATVERIPDQYLARAEAQVTRSLIDRLERLHSLGVSDDVPAVISSKKAENTKLPITTTTLDIGGAVVKVSKHDPDTPSIRRSGYAMNLGYAAPSMISKDGGSELGRIGLNHGDNFESGSIEYDRRRLEAALEFAENVGVVEKAIGLPELSAFTHEQAWLDELLAASQSEPAAV
jgi:hypothetical protein